MKERVIINKHSNIDFTVPPTPLQPLEICIGNVVIYDRRTELRGIAENQSSNWPFGEEAC